MRGCHEDNDNDSEKALPLKPCASPHQEEDPNFLEKFSFFFFFLAANVNKIESSSLHLAYVVRPQFEPRAAAHETETAVATNDFLHVRVHHLCA